MEEFELTEIKGVTEENAGKAMSANGVRVILDGAHNGDSVELFLKGLRNKYPNSQIYVLFGAGLEKQLDDMLKQLQQHANSVSFLQAKHFKAAAEQELVSAAESAGFKLPISKFYPPPMAKTDGGTVRLSYIKLSISISLYLYISISLYFYMPVCLYVMVIYHIEGGRRAGSYSILSHQ